MGGGLPDEEEIPRKFAHRLVLFDEKSSFSSNKCWQSFFFFFIRERERESSICADVPMEEVEEAVRSLKAGKSPRVDNVPSELESLAAVSQKILEREE